MPSTARPTSTWLAFLPARAEEPASLSHWGEGGWEGDRNGEQGPERRGRCQGPSAQPCRTPARGR